MFAARVAGWETIKERADGGEGVLSAILEKLGNGGTVELAARVTSGGAATSGMQPIAAVNLPHTPPQSQIRDEQSQKWDISPHIEGDQVAVTPTRDASG
jgi:hypothetical protein